ncbi:MAG: MAPEG family protein [Polyangia bacterium]
MRSEAIFVPVSVLALWTTCVLLMTGFRRVRAVRARRISSDAFQFGESRDVPPDVALPNRNLMNLLEMPLLFYVVAVALYVTHHAGHGAVRLAWIYVVLRVLHTCEHLTSNHVRRRLVVFAASNFVLAALWIRFLVAVL